MAKRDELQQWVGETTSASGLRCRVFMTADRDYYFFVPLDAAPGAGFPVRKTDLRRPITPKAFGRGFLGARLYLVNTEDHS